MQSATSEEVKLPQGSGTRAKPRQARLTLILVVTFLYLLLEQPLLHYFGPPTSALIAVPVALTGWYFGINSGVIAAFLAIALNTVFLTALEGGQWQAWLISSWPGNAMVIVLGYVAGRLQQALVSHAFDLDELRSRDRYLAMVNLATQNILDSKDLNDTYPYLVSNLAVLFEADYANFFRWDAQQKQALLVASTLPLDPSIPHRHLGISEAGLIVAVMRSGRARFLDDLTNSDYIVGPAQTQEGIRPVQSAICIPVLAGENQLGAMVIAYARPRKFTAQEINYAELAGTQIALALWTAEQQLVIRKRLREANALSNIERVLSESERVGIETILQLITDSAKELIPGAEQAVLHLLDSEQKYLMPRAIAGAGQEATTPLRMHLGQGIAGQVVQSGLVIAVGDTRTDSRFLDRAEPSRFRSIIVAPIQSNERRVGTISVQSNQPHAFTSDESQLLEALGTHAAIAIENANLLEVTRRDLKEINSLYRVNQGLASSLDPDQVMKDVVELLKDNFGYYHVQSYLVDPQSQDVVASHGSGIIGDQLREQAYRLLNGDGIIGHVVETGQPFVTNNVDDVVFFKRNPFLPDTTSELTVPIKTENRVLGALDIQRRAPSRFSARDLQLVATVADQLAIALQKAELYSQLRASLNQEKETRTQLIYAERLAVVGRLLASVSHELNNPLQAIQNALFLLKDDEGISAQGHQDLELILSETERMASLIGRLRASYRPTSAKDFQEIQLNAVVEDVYALMTTYLRHRKITFEFLAGSDLPVILGIPDQIRQVVLNLFMNGAEAMPSGGRLVAHTQFLGDKNGVLFSVADTGSGIDPQILPQIFEPFVTNKENGTGLGLTITADIVRRHNGEIQAKNNEDGGATFWVWLPRGEKEIA